MCSDTPDASHQVVVETAGLSKCYQIYARPQDRLRQFFARGDKRFYREFWALRGVDLQVRRGETLGIVGRNGAGKSTLLQLIAGTLKPTAGSVEVRGRVTALLELGSGFHHDFTGRENVYVAGALLGLAREQMDERMPRIEAFADIGEFLDRPVKTYSKGMFARLSFSVYANLDPDVFIVDEALAVGDAKFRHKCMYRFKQMQDQGVAVVYVSHDAASMKHLCDRVAWIHQGALQGIGEPSQVVDDYLYHLFHDQQPRGKAATANAVRGDDDLGSREAIFVRCELLNANGAPTEHLTGGEECTLRLELRNDGLPTTCPTLLVGFSISNVQGLAISGTNNLHNDVVIVPPQLGASITARYRFRLPRLATGNYAISVTAMLPREEGDPTLLHAVPNALKFQASTSKKVFGLLGLDCEVEVEANGGAAT